MPSSLDRYKKDLDALIGAGEKLYMAIQRECDPDEFDQELEKVLGPKAKDFLKELPSFRDSYQAWYSEAKALVRQLLPDRLADFVRHYEKPRPRKDITFENYRIEDALQGLQVTRPWDGNVVGSGAAIPHVRQQIAIVKSVKARFESSLLDIRQLVQADLLDSELDAASVLAKHGFARAAGAVAGVVLERHLAQVCVNHGLSVAKKTPSIADFNDALKNASGIDLAQWRFNQHLADIRNLCDHNKSAEPTPAQVDDLITGALKVTKTLF